VVPVNITLTSDTSLVTVLPSFIPAGTSSGSYTFADDWDGYQKSSFTSLNASFGSKTSELSDMGEIVSDTNFFSAHVVFDKDTPTFDLTKSFFILQDGDGFMQLGQAIVSGAQALIDSSIVVFDSSAGTRASGGGLQVQKVPEDLSTLAAFFCSLGLLTLFGWRVGHRRTCNVQR
jgi:hypothetical protein